MHKDNIIEFPSVGKNRLDDLILEQWAEAAEQAMELEKQSQELLAQSLKILEAMKALEKGIPE